MVEHYLSDKEYKDYFSKFNNVRYKIIKDLPIKRGMHILDLATGYGFFAIEIAKRHKTITISGIDISKDGVLKARKNIKEQGLSKRVKIFEMDTTHINFPNGHFDMVVNFLGLEDIHMTRRKKGVRKTFVEVNRVLKPGGYFCFAIMPPNAMETQAQKIEVALYSYICNATWLLFNEYKTMIKNTKFKFVSKNVYYTHKKLTPKQAKTEIRFACKNVPKIYGIKTPSFNDVWSRFGEDIEKNGLGQCSKVMLIKAQKYAQ